MSSDVNKDWTHKDQDKDKDQIHKDKDKDLKLVLKESLRTRTRINITAFESRKSTSYSNDYHSLKLINHLLNK